MACLSLPFAWSRRVARRSCWATTATGTITRSTSSSPPRCPSRAGSPKRRRSGGRTYVFKAEYQILRVEGKPPGFREVSLWIGYAMGSALRFTIALAGLHVNTAWNSTICYSLPCSGRVGYAWSSDWRRSLDPVSGAASWKSPSSPSTQVVAASAAYSSPTSNGRTSVSSAAASRASVSTNTNWASPCQK
jgi:hypothetical protein